MKTKHVKVLLSAAIVLLMAWAFASCSKSNDAGPTVNKSVLNDSIAAATTLSSSTTEGTQDGQYTVGSKATLGLAITAAQAVSSNSASTQDQVNNSVVSLTAAMTAYRAAKVVPVASDALVAHWSFNEGTGTTAGDESANNFDGTFKAGPSKWGSVMPVWTVDRKGTVNAALQFNKGASVEIPYNTKLNPVGSITIATWVRTDTTNANNRFIGLQSWLGYKFQLQDGNLPYFSVYTTKPGDVEQDSKGAAIPLHTWHHIVVTYKDGEMQFYVDGASVATWTGNDAKGTPVSISAKPYNLVLGADFPADKYSSDPNGTNFDNAASPDYHVIPLAWGGHYIGALDEMRIYNIALSSTQVKSVYDREK